jgi:chemotaxis signal transduction protein
MLPVGSEWHLLDVLHVREVVSEPQVTELPTALRAVLGVFNLRGEIIPLLDPLALLGLGRLSSSEVSYAIVVDSAHGPAGMAATGVAETVMLGEPVGASESRGTLASYAIGFRVATLLDVDALLVPAHLGESW